MLFCKQKLYPLGQTDALQAYNNRAVSIKKSNRFYSIWITFRTWSEPLERTRLQRFKSDIVQHQLLRPSLSLTGKVQNNQKFAYSGFSFSVILADVVAIHVTTNNPW